MKADAIRELNERLQNGVLSTKTGPECQAGMMSAAVSILAELAAQVAELNENIASLKAGRGDMLAVANFAQQ